MTILRVGTQSRASELPKAIAALELIRIELPECCNAHLLPGEETGRAAEGGQP